MQTKLSWSNINFLIAFKKKKKNQNFLSLFLLVRKQKLKFDEKLARTDNR